MAENPAAHTLRSAGPQLTFRSMTSNRSEASLLTSIRFAAQKHTRQRRKAHDATPYINHPIAVAELVARIGEVTDLATLKAAVLHDTLEDTTTTRQELDEYFREKVCLIVVELTDDKGLQKDERKRLQIEHAPLLSTPAKQIKIADKVSNIEDIPATQPIGWSLERKREYLDWAANVVDGCRGSNRLEHYFDTVLTQKRKEILLLNRSNEPFSYIFWHFFHTGSALMDKDADYNRSTRPDIQERDNSRRKPHCAHFKKIRISHGQEMISCERIFVKIGFFFRLILVSHYCEHYKPNRKKQCRCPILLTLMSLALTPPCENWQRLSFRFGFQKLR